MEDSKENFKITYERGFQDAVETIIVGINGIRIHMKKESVTIDEMLGLLEILRKKA